MVALSFGYVNGFMDDLGSTTGWTLAGTGGGDTATQAIDNGDYLLIDLTAIGGDASVYSEYDMTNISSDTYPTIRWRVKTNNSTVKYKIVLVFTVGTQTVLAEGSSTTFTVGSTTITSGKTIDKIQLYATTGIGEVYYDFIQIYQGDFTLPNIAYGMNMDFPPQEALIPIPGRDTQITQNLGTESAIVTISCDLDQNTWQRTTPADTIDGQMFLDMLHNRSGEPWQWLDTGDHQFKVSVHPKFRWEKQARILDLTLKEYSLGSKSQVNETYKERWGIGL